MFKLQTKAFLTHIPYRGAGPALQDLMAGNVDMMFDGPGSSAAHIKGGRIKALMVSGAKRSPAFPDVPCSAELGLPDYNVTTWYGGWAPRGTPADAQTRAVEEIRKACQAEEAKAVWGSQGAEFPNLTGPQFAAFIKAELAKWAQVAVHNVNMFRPAPPTASGQTAQMVAVLRGYSLLLSCITVVLAFALARQVWPSGPKADAIVLLSTAMVAFNPKAIFINASTNNDNLLSVLSTAVLLLCVQTLNGQMLTRRRQFLLGVLLGLAALTKISGLVVWPIVLLTFAQIGVSVCLKKKL